MTQGLEPLSPQLGPWCSTKLNYHHWTNFWTIRLQSWRGSNPRPPAWQAGTLNQLSYTTKFDGLPSVSITVIISVRSWLTFIPTRHMVWHSGKLWFTEKWTAFRKSSRWRDLNPRPRDYKSRALPAELHRHKNWQEVFCHDNGLNLLPPKMVLWKRFISYIVRSQKSGNSN